VSERLGMDGDGLHRRRLLRHLNLLAVTAPLPYISSQASSHEARRDEATGGAGARVGQRMCSFKHLPPQGDGNQRTAGQITKHIRGVPVDLVHIQGLGVGESGHLCTTYMCRCQSRRREGKRRWRGDSCNRGRRGRCGGRENVSATRLSTPFTS